MQNNKFGLSILFSIAVAMMISSQANAQVNFGFDNADFDNGAGIGAATTVGGITATIVDVFAPEFAADANGDFVRTGGMLFASNGDMVGTQVQSDDLGVDNPSVENDDFEPFIDPNTGLERGSGNENRDLNDGEGFVIEFDQDVIFTELDFASFDTSEVGSMVVATVEGIGSFTFLPDDANVSDIFSNPFGASIVIPAGANITIEVVSPTTPGALIRLDDFTVVLAADVDLINFPFNNNTEFDNDAGIGTTTAGTSANGDTATITLVDIFARDINTGALLSGASGGVTTQIRSNNLGINNPSVEDVDFFPFIDPITGVLTGSGIENRDINDGEGLTFEFDIPVIFTVLDFGSFSGLNADGTETEPGSMVTVTIEGVGSSTIVPDLVNNGGAVFTNPFGTDFIPAGADITIEFSSATPSASVRIQNFVVSTVPVMADCMLGDVDMNGAVEFLDIQPFIDVLANNGFQCEADVDEDGMVTFLDIQPFINILAGL